MTFLEAALEILKRERKPLHYKELTEKAMERKLLTFVGRTPEVTMQTQLTSAVKKAPGAPFVRVKPGVFGLLRYPEAAPEPKVQDEKKEEKKEDKKEDKKEQPAVASTPTEEKTAEAGEGLARGRRRRRGGRGRRRDRRPGEETGTDETKIAAPDGESAPGAAGEGVQTSALADEQDGEEPNVGSLSPEARAAALAETGVLEGDLDEAEEADEEADEEAAGQEESVAGEAGADVVASEGNALAEGDERTVPAEGVAEATPVPVVEGEAAAPTSTSTRAMPSKSAGGSDPSGTGGRKVMSPVDAAIEILKGQSPGRGVHVRQIADSAIRRRLIHGEPNEAWRVMRAALASEAKERLRAGVRPRIKAAGSGLFALSRRTPDADLEKAEYVFGEARRALRERTLAAVEQRLGELSPASFEAMARVLLQREGFGPATFVKRVDGTIYVEALRGRGFRPSKCLIALRPGITAAGRRALGELRAGIRARSQDEGVLLLAGRLADDAIAEWKQSGQPIEVVDGPAMAETCVRHGIGVISANVAVDLVDADFFAELSEG
jgi:hypothetical protein